MKAGGINPPAVASHQPFEVNGGQQGNARIAPTGCVPGRDWLRCRPGLVVRGDGGAHFRLEEPHNAPTRSFVHSARGRTLISSLLCL